MNRLDDILEDFKSIFELHIKSIDVLLAAHQGSCIRSCFKIQLRNVPNVSNMSESIMLSASGCHLCPEMANISSTGQ